MELIKNKDNEYLAAEAIAGQQTREEGEAFRQRYPIVGHLPYRSLIFDIDYKVSEDTIVLQIRAPAGRDRQYALDQIQNWGFNPSNFKIEYRD